MSSPPPDTGPGAFHPPRERVRWFSNVICGAIPSQTAPIRVLDIGCGTGDQLFDLAARLPNATLTGVDIVPANAAIARERQAADASGHRMTFEAVDYLAYTPPAPFDVLIAYSVLQFVPGGTDTLAGRIAGHAAPGALVVNVMPHRCAYNRALAAVRRMMRAVRSPALDAVVLAAARGLHGGAMSRAMLAERLTYAYAVPLRFEEALASALEARGFRTERRRPVAHASVGQLKHALRIMRAPR